MNFCLWANKCLITYMARPNPIPVATEGDTDRSGLDPVITLNMKPWGKVTAVLVDALFSQPTSSLLKMQ